MRLLILLFGMLCLGSAAHAASEPIVAPAGEWVERLPIPAPDPAHADRPFQALLITSQSLYGADHIDHYSEMAMLVQNSQGLQGLGSLALPWQPDQSDLIIHKVEIRRGDTVIDLLAQGRRFTVLRRENNLESAMLDGVLTAVMQAEGLAVGDILSVAFTVRRRAGALPLRGENAFLLPYGVTTRRFHVRQIWPDDIPMQWRAGGMMEQARTRRTRRGTELHLDLADAEGIQPPEQAPARFMAPIQLQLTQYRDWAGVSADLHPHFVRASELAADSPLRAQIERIAAASQDPAARALAALRLVQDEIRYFAVMLNNGNYVPATADETWTRRYGDCKGKTAMLIALLNGLGIDAEPVLVNPMIGDGLDTYLPQLSLFNHVIVRAWIGGRSYWLDGTRTGDRRVADLASSRFGWGLPLRAADATLERLPFAPSDLPATETHFTYDASRGLVGAVPTSGEMIFRGDLAVMMRQLQGQQGEQTLRQMARQALGTPQDGPDPEISQAYDDAAGAFTLRFSGTRELSWSGFSGRRGVAYEFDRETIEWNPHFDRETGANRDAPFLLPATGYLMATETLILPRNGEGFALIGENFEQTVAGVQIRREVTLANGRAVARSSFRPLQMEISAAEARASQEAVRTLRENNAGVRAPGAVLTATDRQALQDRNPTTAQEYLDRGLTYMRAGSHRTAIEDFERAATLAPEWSRPVSNQAVAQVYRGNLDEADALLTRAEALDANDFVVHQARGLVQLARNRPIQAVAAFTRALAAEPDSSYSQLQRARAYQMLGELDEALIDINGVLARNPADRDALAAKARIHTWRNQPEEAIAAADALVATDPRNPVLIRNRAMFLGRLGRQDEAARDFSAALAIVEAREPQGRGEEMEVGQLRHMILADSGRTREAVALIGTLLAEDADNPLLLNNRCWVRATANVELEAALADCNRALQQEPRNAATLDSRALVRLRMGQLDAAIADATAAIEISPQHPAALYVRGIARLRRGDMAGGEQDLDAARRLTFDIDATYRGYHVTSAANETTAAAPALAD